MSDAIYQQALAVTALFYRLTADGDPADEPRLRLRKKALDLPGRVRKVVAKPSAGEVVRLRSTLADFRQWLEDQQLAGVAMPLTDFDRLAGRLSRGLSSLRVLRSGP